MRRAVALLLALSACSAHDVELIDGATDATGGDVVAPDGGDGDASDLGVDAMLMPGCTPASCEGHVTECADCIDNDGDGRFDSDDPECLGPCDNTEGAGLLPGVGGDTSTNCSHDCYFDFGEGSGNDDCYWDHRCDPYEVAPGFWPQGTRCTYDASRVGGAECPATQSSTCHTVCAALTPSGCDCFGCCTFDALHGRAATDGGEYVYIGSAIGNDSSCTLAVLTDTTLCQPCTPVADCLNTCGRCELCVGRTTLPPDCLAPPDGGTNARCADGLQPCGLPSDPECPTGTYCITGCCSPFG